ncbi:MAG: hypothetical protein WC717_03495 [Candidatus Micrarchaeia archaeon]|jgi:hypothetical protein
MAVKTERREHVAQILYARGAFWEKDGKRLLENAKDEIGMGNLRDARDTLRKSIFYFNLAKKSYGFALTLLPSESVYVEITRKLGNLASWDLANAQELQNSVRVRLEPSAYFFA